MTLSVAIATYNGARFLREQLDSIYRQTHLPDEVVVSDDGSTDGTLAILEEYKQRYGLKYSVNQGKHGVNANFFKAMALCTGELISICDQDDIWFPNKLETLYAHIITMDMRKPCVVSSLRQDINAAGEVLSVIHAPYTEGWAATLLTYSRNQGCTMVFNRALLDILLPTIYRVENSLTTLYYDEWVAYAGALLGDKHNLPDILMSYRHHDKNTVDGAGHYEKKTFRQKVHDLPVFYGFIPDERFIPLEIVYRTYQSSITNQEIVDFLDKICRCNGLVHPFQKLGVILTMHCLPWYRKIVIAVKSTISITLKAVFE